MRTEEEIKERIKLQEEGLKNFKKSAKEMEGFANKNIAGSTIIAVEGVIKNLKWVLNEEMP